jgi:diaminohydroxyphosphoribosylaminopyrimidine deaminase/5-amino-6-(5-phosphoribosylamino)uracil reductase
MASALRLAEQGLTTTHPNPRVGCVIAKHGVVCGQGWHRKAGDSHAEVYALENAGVRAIGATAYVTLEPCSHHGRTSPCTEALISAGIKRVVCAIQDPNPKVAGSGITQLEAAGIEVECGLMGAQAEALNQGFLKRMRSGMPWVRVKMAQSLDGHIALANGTSQWISGPQARDDVQQWRARSAAILTGVGTVLADNPSLNVRNHENARQPLRVIADSHWRTPADAKMLSDGGGAVLIAGLDEHPVPPLLAASTAELCALPASNGLVDLTALLEVLGRRGINEVQVEAGSMLAGSLLAQQLIDELLIYQAPILLGGGAVSPFATPRLDNMNHRVHLKWLDSRRIGDDLRLRLRPES